MCIRTGAKFTAVSGALGLILAASVAAQTQKTSLLSASPQATTSGSIGLFAGFGASHFFEGYSAIAFGGGVNSEKRLNEKISVSVQVGAGIARQAKADHSGTKTDFGFGPGGGIGFVIKDGLHFGIGAHLGVLREKAKTSKGLVLSFGLAKRLGKP